MAERRMFAMTIVDSDAFLDMPLSSQALYFHLSMRADDEGFINNPKKIARMIGASEDDMKVLISKNFIIPFESGIVVIKHWNINNSIRGDRFRATLYQDERSLIELKENKSYTLCITVGNQVTTNCQPSDNQVTTNGIPSIGKDRLGKVSGGKVNSVPPFTLENVTAYIESRGNKIDPVKFFNYYGEGLPDWQAKVEEWERTQYKKPSTNQKDPWATYDIDAWEKMLMDKAR